MRTPGSGWGNGRTKLWQVCPLCGKKKMYYRCFYSVIPPHFWCTWCKNDVTPKLDFETQEYPPGFIRQEHKQ